MFPCRNLGAAQDGLHKFAFCLGVGVAVGAVLVGECALQKRVGVGIIGMGAKVVSEGEMTVVLLAIRRAEIEVVRRVANRLAEGLTSGNAEIALMLVSQCGESAYRGSEAVGRLQEHVDIDDRLGSESGNCRAADVLDRCRERAEGSAQS